MAEEEDSEESLAQTTSGKVAWLVLVFAVITQTVAYLFFLEQGIKVGGIDFTEDENVFGWYLQGLSFMFAVLTMFLALKLRD